MILCKHRHVCLLAVALIVGILLSERPKRMWYVLCALLAFGLWLELNISSCGRHRLLFLGICFALTCTGYGLTQYRSQVYESQLENLQSFYPSGDACHIQGRVYRKAVKNDSCLYYLKQSYYLYDNQIVHTGRILVYGEQDLYAIGTVLDVEGKADWFSSGTNDGSFDSKAYYKSQGIVCRLFASEMKAVSISKYSIGEVLFDLQQRISRVYESELNSRDSGVLGTMVVGNRGMLDTEVRSTYQKAGISHILAVSGLHISILGYGLYRMLRRLTCPYTISALLSFFVVFCFSFMSGFGVSSLRAMLMYAVLMGAAVTGRVYDGITSLAIAALVLLLMNPLSLFQSGFLFSFTAMICMLLSGALFHLSYEALLAENDLPRWKRWGRRLGRRVLSGCILQLWMLPLTAWFYYEVPVYGLFLNLLVLPLCSVLLGLGFVGGVLGMYSVILSKWALVGCHFILEFYQLLIQVTSMIPGNYLVVGRPPVWFMISYYTALSTSMTWCIYRKQNLKARYSLAGVALALGIFLFGPWKCGPRVDFLDVGQGDGAFVSNGTGICVMLDGGSTSESQIGTYTILPFLKYHRVRKVDLWIVTHTDEDHISGLREVLSAGYPVKQVVFSATVSHNQAFTELTELAKQNDTAVAYAVSGDEVSLGTWTMSCLFPGSEDYSEDTNDTSLVWLLNAEQAKMLFTGDIGAEQEELLLNRELLKDVDVLKCAHHGSKYSTCDAFLQAVKPEVTVISCGAGNFYGHPHSQTLQRLKQAGSRVLMTMEDGQISLLQKRGKWLIKYQE